MKLLIGLFILTTLGSCSILGARQAVSDKMRDCVYELVGQHGVSAEEATKSCEAIYKRRGE